MTTEISFDTNFNTQTLLSISLSYRAVGISSGELSEFAILTLFMQLTYYVSFNLNVNFYRLTLADTEEQIHYTMLSFFFIPLNWRASGMETRVRLLLCDISVISSAYLVNVLTKHISIV